jgi:phage shock protein PspC (stress-responsive transcriptional regulator)
MRKYYRSEGDKKIWGVCSGLARYTNSDVAIWRVLFLASIFTPFPAILFYCIATIVTESIEYLD